MTKSEIEDKIEKLKKNKFLPDALKEKQIKKLLAEIEATSIKVPKNDNVKPGKMHAKFKEGDEVIFYSHKGLSEPSVFVVKQILGKDEELGDIVYRIKNKNNQEDVEDKMERTLVKYKPSKKSIPAFKGKPVKELKKEDCKEFITEVSNRRKESAKSAEKSRTRPVVEKTVGSIATGVKHAIKNVSVEDIKDNPTKELGKIDQAIALTKKFAQDLKALLGEDYDAETVAEELKPLVDLSKELHQKYDK